MSRSPIRLQPSCRPSSSGRRRWPAVVAVGLAVLLRPAPDLPSIAQAPQPPRALTFTPVGRFGGPLSTLAADGTRVFAVHAGVVQSYDVSDVAAPRLVGTSAPVADAALLAAGDGLVAALADRTAPNLPAATLTVLDGTVDALPVESTVVLPGCEVRGAQIASGRVAVACGAGGVRIVDVRSTGGPTVVPLLMPGLVQAVAYDGRRLLVGKALRAEATRGAVALYDVTDVLQPVPVAATAWPEPVAGVALAGAHGVIASEYGVRVAVVRLGGPDRFEITAEQSTRGISHGRLAVAGTRAVLVSTDLRGDSFVIEIDTTRPAAPFAVGPAANGGITDVVPLPDGLVVIDARRGLVAFARRADGVYGERGQVVALTGPFGAAFKGDDLIVADNDAEIWALDVADPAAIAVRGRASIRWAGETNAWFWPTRGGGLVITDRLAVVTRGASFWHTGGLAVVDIADLTAIRPRYTWTIDDENGAAALAREFGFDTNGSYDPVIGPDGILATSSSGLAEFGPPDGSAPRLQRLWRDGHGCTDPGSTVYGDCAAYGIVLDGTTAYVANGQAGVRAYDLRPGAPAGAVRTFDGPPGARDVAVVGDALLVVHGDGRATDGLRAIDRRTGAAVRSVHGFSGDRIEIEDDTAFVSARILPDQVPAVLAFDVRDPFAPVSRGREEISGPYDPSAPPHVAVNGDLLAVVSTAGVSLYRLADGDVLRSTTPESTVTPWPTWYPGEPGARSTVIPLPTATPSAPPAALYLPIARNR